MKYNWPGNIRELENAVEGAVIMASGNEITLDDLPNLGKFKEAEGAGPAEARMSSRQGAATDLRKVVEEPEREHILNVLNQCHWNRNKAASALGINRTTLYNKMKKYNLKKPQSHE